MCCAPQRESPLATAVDVEDAAIRPVSVPGGDLLGKDWRLLDLLPVAAYTCDRDGMILRYNRLAAELWGRSPKVPTPAETFCGSLRMLRPDGSILPHAECPMAVVLRTGEPLRDTEVVIERPDGTHAVALVNIDPLLDASGAVVGAINCFRDVTEQRPAHVALAEAERLKHDVLRALPAAIYMTDADGRLTFYNDAAAELWGFRPQLGLAQWCGSWQLYWPDGRPMPHAECPMAQALKEGRPIEGGEAIAKRPDGSRIRFRAYPTPLHDDAGRIVGAVNMLVDYDNEHATQLLASIVQSSDDAIASKDLNGVITSWNRGAEKLFGYTAEEAIGRPVTILIPIDRHDEEPDILQRIRRGEGIDHYETVRQRKDGTLIDISLSVSPIRNSQGEIIGASKIARDITDRRRAEEQRELVLREMGHRVKNLFALASSIVGQSARWAETPEEAATAAKQRLAALAQAHDIMLSGQVGKDVRRRSASLSAIINAMLSPYVAEDDDPADRYSLSGPFVLVGGDAITSFALLLHELATNAAKYGALSTPDGRIAVEWSVEEEELRLIWREEGGPTLEGAPERAGFGSTLADGTVRSQFGGELSREWRAEGLVIALSVPTERLGG